MLQTIKQALKPFRKLIGKYPEKYVGPPVVNKAGFQVARVLWKNFFYKIKSFQSSKDIEYYRDALDRDGVVAIPNFLDQDAFNKIQSAYGRLSDFIALEPCVSQGTESMVSNPEQARILMGTVKQNQKLDRATELFTLLNAYVHTNPTLRNLAASVLKTNSYKFTQWEIFVHKKFKDVYPDLDAAAYFHPDNFYPEFKGFLYLRDVTEENGAFIYALGSHKLTVKRLKFEYIKSVRYAQLKSETYNKFVRAWPDGRGWHCLTQDEEQMIGLKPKSIIGKANTLLFFNAMGVHRRGDFTSERSRIVASFGVREA